MHRTREHLSRAFKDDGRHSDFSTMPARRRSLIDRVIARFRRDRNVLVLVSTTRGVRAVRVPLRDLR